METNTSTNPDMNTGSNRNMNSDMNSNMNTSTTQWDRSDYYAQRKAVAALFPSAAEGQKAVMALKAKGISADQIGVAMRDRDAQGAVMEETGTHATSGAVKGAVGGGVLGGIAGFLVGVGALAIPGIGPVVSAGILSTVLGTAGATAVAGAAVGGTVGGVAGALVGLGIPHEEAKYFDEGFRKGGMLVTVNTSGNASEVAQMLQQNGGDLSPASQTSQMSQQPMNTSRR